MIKTKHNFSKGCIILSMWMMTSCGSDDGNTITNLPPVVASQTFEASENINDDDVIGTVQASDPEGGSLSFSIVENSGGLFEIASSGELTLTTGTSLDFENLDSHTLTVSASDGELESDAIVTINVIEVDENIAPTVSDQTFSVIENIAETAVIGTVAASDEDGDMLSFSITEDLDDLFEITGPGEITLKDGKNLDFETKTSHQIVVQVSDGSKSVDASVTIEVTDFNEATASFSSPSQEVSEGNSVTISISLTEALSEAGTLVLDVSGSATENTDFTTNPTLVEGQISLNIASGATTATFEVEIINDSFNEATEDVLFTINNSNTVIGGTQASFTLNIPQSDTRRLAFIDQTSSTQSVLKFMDPETGTITNGPVLTDNSGNNVTGLSSMFYDVASDQIFVGGNSSTKIGAADANAYIFTLNPSTGVLTTWFDNSVNSDFQATVAAIITNDDGNLVISTRNTFSTAPFARVFDIQTKAEVTTYSFSGISAVAGITKGKLTGSEVFTGWSIIEKHDLNTGTDLNSGLNSNPKDASEITANYGGFTSSDFDFFISLTSDDSGEVYTMWQVEESGVGAHYFVMFVDQGPLTSGTELISYLGLGSQGSTNPTYSALASIINTVTE